MWGMAIFEELRAICHCVNCSENNKCLSRGYCETGYWGDNCMLYEILHVGAYKQLAVYATIISVFSNATLVRHQLFLGCFAMLGKHVGVIVIVKRFELFVHKQEIFFISLPRIIMSFMATVETCRETNWRNHPGPQKGPIPQRLKGLLHPKWTAHFKVHVYVHDSGRFVSSNLETSSSPKLLVQIQEYDCDVQCLSDGEGHLTPLGYPTE